MAPTSLLGDSPADTLQPDDSPPESDDEGVGVSNHQANPHETLDFDEDDEEEGDGKDESSDGEVLSEEEEEVEKVKEREVVEKESEKEEEEDDDDGELVDDDEDEEDGEDGEVGECKETSGGNKVNDSRDSDSVEEGEVTDEEVISEIDRKDNKPVCRFFSKGTCTWGNNCRFLHPGVTDKGLYSMFETVPPPPPPHHAPMKPALLGPGPVPPQADGLMGPPVHESAWERGLRHAKEIIRASAKRKQTDVDFEEKKINLSLLDSDDEEVDDKENTHYVRKPELEEKKSLVTDDFEIDEQEFITARAELSRNKIDPDFVRERVHRVKSGQPRIIDHHHEHGRSPPPRRMVRESELRKLEIEMMMGGEKEDKHAHKRPPQGTDPYGRNIPRQISRSSRQPRSFKPRGDRSRSRSSVSSDSSSESSTSSVSSSSRRRSRRTRYYSRDSEDSRVSERKRKREKGTESSASDTSGSRRVRRRRDTVSSTSTSRSRSKSGDRRRRGRPSSASRSRSRSSSSSRKSDGAGQGNGGARGRFVRKAPPRELDRGNGGVSAGGPRQLRIAPPLPRFNFNRPEPDEPEPYVHRTDCPPNYSAPPSGYRRAPPPRPGRWGPRGQQQQPQQRQNTRPIGLVRERDLMHQGQPPPPPQSVNPPLPIEEPPSSPKDKTPIASPSGSVTGSPRRTKTRYKREYSSERVSRSRSRSRSFSNSRSRSASSGTRKRRSGSRGSSTSFSRSGSGSRSPSRSRSTTPMPRGVVAPPPGQPLRKAPPPPDSPSPPPRTPPPQQQQKPKQNQIKLTLKHSTVRAANKHVIQRLGGLAEEEDDNAPRAPLPISEGSNEGIASTPQSPTSVPLTEEPISSTPSSRREELLKQLKAVEEAIAKKRSKLDSK